VINYHFLYYFFFKNVENIIRYLPGKEVFEMDVNAISMINNFSADMNIQNRGNNGISSGNPVPGLRKNEYNFENATMNIDDMKSILYMMLRGKSVQIAGYTNKIGLILNKMA